MAVSVMSTFRRISTRGRAEDLPLSGFSAGKRIDISNLMREKKSVLRIRDPVTVLFEPRDPDHFSELRNNFWVNILQFFDADSGYGMEKWDPGWKKLDPGWENLNPGWENWGPG